MFYLISMQTWTLTKRLSIVTQRSE